MSDYNNVALHSPDLLDQALNTVGAAGTVFMCSNEADENGALLSTYSIDIIESPNSGAVPAAVALATLGTVFADSAIKIDEIQTRTGTLALEGVSFLGKGPIEVSEEFASFLSGRIQYAEAGILQFPTIIPDLSGRGATCANLSELQAAQLAVVIRGRELLYDTGGEYDLIAQVTAAARDNDRTALDAVVDGRV